MRTLAKITLTILALVALLVAELYGLYLVIVLYFFGLALYSLLVAIGMVVLFYVFYKAPDWYDTYAVRKAINRNLGQ